MQNGFSPPAFPNSGQTGLTKREYAAIEAMKGLLARHTYATVDIGGPKSDIDPKGICNDAIVYADELLKQLDEK